MVSITTDYISVGGNRHPAAADWDVQSGVLAFGADNNVALWDPRVCAAETFASVMFVVLRFRSMLSSCALGKFSTRGLLSPRRTYRQSQRSQVLHMPDDRHEAPCNRLGRSHGSDMAIQHNGLAPIRTCADS